MTQIIFRESEKPFQVVYHFRVFQSIPCRSPSFFISDYFRFFILALEKSRATIIVSRVIPFLMKGPLQDQFEYLNLS